MALVRLSRSEREVVGECLRALAYGPFLPDWEYHALTGLERADFAEVAQRWPAVDEADPRDAQALHGSILALLYGPIRNYDSWDEYISVGYEDAELIARKYRGETQRSYLEHLRSLVTPPRVDTDARRMACPRLGEDSTCAQRGGVPPGRNV